MSAARHTLRLPGAARRRAFTVVELLVAISVLTLIVVVLYKIFDQTQKAMRSNSAQVDVSEGGRAAMELIARDLEQMTVAPVPGSTSFYMTSLVSTVQRLVPTNYLRTNFLQDVFFTSQFNKQLAGIGYQVVPYTNSTGQLFPSSVGMLCRFEKDAAIDGNPNLVLKVFTNSATLAAVRGLISSSPFQRVTDGIVHFRITAYDSLGYPMNRQTSTDPRRGVHYATVSAVSTNILGVQVRTNNVQQPTAYYFTDVVPPFVEVEVGILEPQVLDRWKSMPNPQMAADYLARQAGKVTLFQQRIPVRTAPPVTLFQIK